MKKLKIKTRYKFTLLELIVSLALFSIVVVVLTKLCNSALNVIESSRESSMVFQNATSALDVISADLQSAYFMVDGNIPFWHWEPPDPTSPPVAWGSYGNELLAFVSATMLPPNDNCTSRLCEVKYQKYYSTIRSDDLDGWLLRSVTGNKETGLTIEGLTIDNPKRNFLNNMQVGFSTTTVDGDPVAAFTADSSSSESYQKLIPYVTKLTFACYDQIGSEITAENDITTVEKTQSAGSFPFTVKVELVLMDKNSWNKWVSLSGNVNPYKEDSDNESLDESAQSQAYKFRKKHERAFIKFVHIGDRGQYE